MTDGSSDIFEEVSNPLDSIEDMLLGNDWVFSRPHSDELNVQVKGKNGTYSLTFIWQEDYSAMQFYCDMTLQIPAARIDMAVRTLAAINERLWLGHFELPEESMVPRFRHTSLFRGCTQSSGTEHVEDLIELALVECERHHAVFNMLSDSRYIDDRAFSLMLTEEAGEA